MGSKNPVKDVLGAALTPITAPVDLIQGRDIGSSGRDLAGSVTDGVEDLGDKLSGKEAEEKAKEQEAQMAAQTQAAEQQQAQETQEKENRLDERRRAAGRGVTQRVLSSSQDEEDETPMSLARRTLIGA